MVLEALRCANPGLDILACDDRGFDSYGTILEGAWTPIVEALERHAPIPEEGVRYVASCAELESAPGASTLLAAAYGGLPAQMGYCAGRNSRMNGMEFHRASELVIAADDLILLLGLRGQMTAPAEGGSAYPSFQTALAKAFLIPRGTAVELYSGTLHLAPCRARATGFRAAIVLPRGTNEDHPGASPIPGDARLLKRNKWIVAHGERAVLTSQGVPIGLTGDNVEVRPVEPEA